VGKRQKRAWEYINPSQIHECRNWERGHAVSFLGYLFRIFGTVCHLSIVVVTYPVESSHFSSAITVRRSPRVYGAFKIHSIHKKGFDIGPSRVLNDWKRTRLSCFVWFGYPPPLSSPIFLSCISFSSSCASPVERTDGKGVGKEPKNTIASKAWPSINHLILSDLADPVYLYIFIS
jgi:hypothetical protein